MVSPRRVVDCWASCLNYKIKTPKYHHVLLEQLIANTPAEATEPKPNRIADENVQQNRNFLLVWTGTHANRLQLQIKNADTLYR